MNGSDYPREITRNPFRELNGRDRLTAAPETDCDTAGKLELVEIAVPEPQSVHGAGIFSTLVKR
jgi:hypothetical protein